MKTHIRDYLIRFLLPLVVIELISCNIISTPIAPTQTPTLLAVSQGLTLGFTTISETGAAPDYTLTAQVPVLSGSDDPRILQFNQQMELLIQQEVNSFKLSLVGASNPAIAMGSSFDLKYSLISPWGDILSLKLIIDSYFDGAAHPSQYSRAFTFDLKTGHQVNLDALFLPETNYIKAISDYCKTELAGRDIAFDASNTGADPLPENYHNWNISSDGLVITFDAYQVAAYAAGPQIITIPYSALASIIDPQGPLANFIQ